MEDTEEVIYSEGNLSKDINIQTTLGILMIPCMKKIIRQKQDGFEMNNTTQQYWKRFL